MNMTLLAILGIVALVALIFLGMNVGISMFVVGIVGYFIATGDIGLALSRLGTVPFTTASSFSYVVIPLFVLMGEFTLESGMAMGLYDIAKSTGANIITATGFHKLMFYPKDHWIRKASEQAT